MKIRLLLWGCAALVVTAAVLDAQATSSLNQKYKTRAAALKDDDAQGHFELAKWTFVNELYTETALECDKLLALDSGDRRASYLKKAAAFYKAGGGKDFIPPETVEPAKGGGPDEGGQTVVEKPPEGALPSAVVFNLSTEQVAAIFKDKGNSMAVFRGTVHPILMRSCARGGCHGSTRTSGAFYLKTQRKTEAKTIAENFKALSNYIDRSDLAKSKLLVKLLEPKEKHPGGPVFRSERDPAYQRLKAWVLSLKEGIW